MVIINYLLFLFLFMYCCYVTSLLLIIVMIVIFKKSFLNLNGGKALLTVGASKPLFRPSQDMIYHVILHSP